MEKFNSKLPDCTIARLTVATIKEWQMTTWRGEFVAVLMSGVVFGILNGHLAIWTAVGAALGAILAGRQKNRAIE